jgi:hypothetical protein
LAFARIFGAEYCLARSYETGIGHFIGNKIVEGATYSSFMRWAMIILIPWKPVALAISFMAVLVYLAGVSVRRVEDITQALWGTRVSASTVSDLNQRIYKADRGVAAAASGRRVRDRARRESSVPV